MTPEAEKAVVHAARKALEARFSAGTTMFFDSTASQTSNQTALAKLAARHGYRTYLLDCQGGTSVETLLERNRRRGNDRVDEQALRDMHARCSEGPVSPMIAKVIDGSQDLDRVAAEITEITAVPEIMPEHDVVVVGDTHSCAEALQDAVDVLDDGDNHWVFAGDLFDRGPDPVGVWHIVHRLLDEGRASVVIGNHELNLRAVNTQTAATRFSDTRRTRNTLLEAGTLAGTQTAFVDGTVPLLVVRGHERDWIVTHGGVGELTVARVGTSGLLHISDAECVYGLGDRARTYRARSSYDVADMPLAGFQLHGHRNGRAGDEPVAAVTHDQHGNPVICLESGASAGGKLSVAVLNTAGGHVVRRFDDRVDPELAKINSMMPWQRKKKADPEDVPALFERMRASENVKIRPVEGVENVVACNFTRKVFVDGAWDELTMHARGLFIDEKAETIAARGYEKFFHIGEAPGRDLDAWMSSSVTSYPVTLRKKYNGYLALVTSVNGTLEVFSKSGVTDYSRFARELLVATIGENGLAKLATMLERTNTTAAFEVIAARDTHPITEVGPDRLILLDCIRNTVTFGTNEKIRDGIAARFDFDTAETVAVAHAPSELEVALGEAAERADEGVVLVDAKGYRSKVKADGYAERKAARTALERMWSGKTDTLGQRFADLERRLNAAGILGCIGEYTVTGVDDFKRLDLARVFDDLERRER